MRTAIGEKRVLIVIKGSPSVVSRMRMLGVLLLCWGSPCFAAYVYVQPYQYSDGLGDRWHHVPDGPSAVDWCQRAVVKAGISHWFIEEMNSEIRGDRIVGYCRIRAGGSTQAWDLSAVCPSPPDPSGSYVASLGGCYKTVTACPSGKVPDSRGVCVPPPVVDDDQTSQPGGVGKPCYGNPIYPLDGTKHQKEGFGRWAGGEMFVEYDSRRKAPGASSALAPLASFGGLWQSQLHRRLVLQFGTSGEVLAVQASRGGANWVSFKKEANGSYVASAGIDDRLSAIAGGWRYVDARAQAVEEYDTSGLLLSRH